MASVNGTNPVMISAADLANMDIETALMTVQTQRANMLETQLKDQMEAVRQRNQQISALNDILAQVRRKRPDGDATTQGTTSGGGNVQVPQTGTSTVIDQVALSAAQDELTRLLNLKAGKVVSGGTGTGTGTSGTLTVPSDFKPTATPGSTAAPYANALSAFIDGRKANPPDYGTAVGSNRQAVDGFVDYYQANKALIDAKYSNPPFSLGFNKNSDDGDIQSALANNPDLRTEYESYLRLSVQGGGTAAKPGTPIVDTSGGSGTSGTSGGTTGGGTTTTTTDIPANIDDLIKQQQDLITRLQAGQQVNGTTFASMSLDDALKFYGFNHGSMTQAGFDQLIQTISARIDGLNSTQQLDMLRLQSLTNKRNEAFDIMTNFLKKMQDSRSSIVGNMR